MDTPTNVPTPDPIGSYVSVGPGKYVPIPQSVEAQGGAVVEDYVRANADKAVDAPAAGAPGVLAAAHAAILANPTPEAAPAADAAATGPLDAPAAPSSDVE
jgi:hypothetical protein